MTLGSDGNIYSTTGNNDGAGGLYGTVYKLTPTGTETTLHTFTNGEDGSYPYWPPIQAANGVLYGTTQDQIAAAPFTPSLPAGHSPRSTPSPAATGRMLTAWSRELTEISTAAASPVAPITSGVIFKMTATGAVTVLHSFAGSDGAVGRWDLLQAKDGNFYGVTLNGGANGAGVIYKITSAGVYTVLYNFPNTGNESVHAPFRIPA